MMIIDKDPATTVPNIREDTADTSLVVLVLHNTECFADIGIATRNQDGRFVWKGGIFNGTNITEWGESSSSSLINMLCFSWKLYLLKKRVHIISSYKELDTVISYYRISNTVLLTMLSDAAYGKFKDYPEAMNYEFLGHRAR